MSLYEKRDFDTNHIEVIDLKTKKVVDRYPMSDIDYLRAETEEESMRRRSKMDFEKRKQEYLNKLTMNIEIIIMMHGEIPTENMKVMLNPSNERELSIAEAVFRFMEDTCRIFMNADLDYEPNIEDNMLIDLCSDVINKVKNKEEIDPNIIDQEDAVAMARLMYDAVTLAFFDEKDISKFIAKKCGLDLDKSVDRQLLVVYFKQISQFTSKKAEPIKQLFSELTDKDIEILIDTFDEFHKLCETKKNIDSDDKSKGTK